MFTILIRTLFARPRWCPHRLAGKRILRAFRISQVLLLAACGSHDSDEVGIPTLHWYVFNEPSGAFREAARRCGNADNYRVSLETLPADSDQQREQLARRLAARDSAIDIIGMDVIWTAEFAQAGWIVPWPEAMAARASAGRFQAAKQSAVYGGRLWAAPYTANAQLLWYRKDRVPSPPQRWQEMIRMAEALGKHNRILVQGERYEGLTVFFVSLLASAGGSILTPGGQLSLEAAPTRKALDVLLRLAHSTAASPAVSTSREDQTRLEFEAGEAAFMVNYTYVWPSALSNAPGIASKMGWARWPGVLPDFPSRVTMGGINLAVSAYSRKRELAFRAAECLASKSNQRLAAEWGGLPPTIESLYDDAAVRRRFPFADLLRDTLKDAVQRPQSPLYTDISIAVSRTLHPLRGINPDRDVPRLRRALERALRSEGLL
ncbi:MAG: ABC transporter substrate-binding protein [Gammaproteobacteria bacterium]